MNEKWEPPEIVKVDNIAFVVIRQHVYDLLHELHIAETYKIANPDKIYNVYWENFCNRVESLSRDVDTAVYNREFDS